MRQETAANLQVLIQEPEYQRKIYNQALDDSDAARRARNAAADAAIMAGVYARLKIPVPAPRPSVPLLTEEDYQELFEPIGYHTAIRHLDNPIEKHHDVPDEEDLDIQQWMRETGESFGRAPDTANQYHQDVVQVDDDSPLSIAETDYVAEIATVKNSVSSYCFPERHKDYSKFVTLLDSLPSMSPTTQRAVLALDTGTCGEIRNSAWSRMLLYFKAPIRIKRQYRDMFASIRHRTTNNEFSLASLSLRCVESYIKATLSGRGLSEEEANRILYGRFS